MVRLFSSADSRPQWLQRVLDALRPHKVLLTIGAGFALQFTAVHFTVSRPLQRQIAHMETQLAASTDQMQSLAALRGTVHRGNDLLAALNAQQATLATSEASLADIRKLRLNLEQEARLTNAATDHLARLGELQNRLADAGRQANELTQVLERLTQLNDRVAALAAPADESLGRVEQANRALAQINLIQAKLAEQAASLPAAQESLDAALRLQTSLANAAPAAETAGTQSQRLIEIAMGLNTVDTASVDVASERASDLLAIHDMLADAEALQLQQAEHNLQTILTTQSQLLRSTPEIAAAAENLELLTDFQAELNRQIQGLESVRKELNEVALLRETIARVSEAVQPLAEMSDLRRLNADQVRAMAREILDRRMAQVPTDETIGPASAIPTESLDLPVPAPMDP